MYKSLVLLSCMSLSISASKPHEFAPVTAQNAMKSAAAIGLAYAVCTPSCVVAGPVGVSACTMKVAAVITALTSADMVIKKTESKK